MCNPFSGSFERNCSKALYFFPFFLVSFLLPVNMAGQFPSFAREAVLKESVPLPEDMPQIRGYDFNQGVDHRALLHSYFTTGFQASSFAMAVQEINKMVCSYSFFFSICL